MLRVLIVEDNPIYFMPEWAAIDGQIVSGRTPPEVPEFVDAMTAAILQ
jgi:hypothetical protein